MLGRISRFTAMLVGSSVFWVPFFTSKLAAQNFPILVNCDAGQSLSRVLSRVPKELPITVNVRGTCTEYLTIVGFEHFTLKGDPGATLQQPSTTPPGGVPSLISIEASHSVTIDGFAIHTASPALAGIAIEQGSKDIRLRNLTMDGGATFEIWTIEASQVSVANVTVSDFGFAGVAAVDVSDVHLEQSTIQSTTGSGFHEGIFVSGGGHVTVQSTTIRNMQIGISAADHGIVDVQSFTSYFPEAVPDDVVIDSPAGTSFWGVEIQGGSSLITSGDAKLRVMNAGEPGGGETGGVWVTDGSAITDDGGDLVISSSKGQGLLVTNDSHATLNASSVMGGGHGGLVALNLSTITVRPGSTLTAVVGNTPDLFCDSQSIISGTSRTAGVPTTNCGNLLPFDVAALP
ncbi:MAG TPA: right-handed parallel beta-helix repeat-containing protein [Terriglobales bacterium]|nr:right-handed parallel beta-helix repeat-containing protein [Terriglobales bacterium]